MNTRRRTADDLIHARAGVDFSPHGPQSGKVLHCNDEQTLCVGAGACCARHGIIEAACMAGCDSVNHSIDGQRSVVAAQFHNLLARQGSTLAGIENEFLQLTSRHLPVIAQHIAQHGHQIGFERYSGLSKCLTDQGVNRLAGIGVAWQRPGILAGLGLFAQCICGLEVSPFNDDNCLSAFVLELNQRWGQFICRRPDADCRLAAEQ